MNRFRQAPWEETFWVCHQTYSQGPDAALLPKEFLSSTEAADWCQQKNAEQFKKVLRGIVSYP